MDTDDLIQALAGDVRRVPARRAAMRVACCTGMALLAATALVWLGLGPRADLAAVVFDPAWLTRMAYTAAIAGFAGLLLLRLGQPGASVRTPLWGLALTVAVVLALVVAEQVSLSGSARAQAWLGHSWLSCSLWVAVFGAAGGPFLFVAARRLAPLRPTLAGAAAGLVSGAVAATAYGLYCTEAATAFYASWYTLGMVIVAGFGAIVGRFGLRW